VNAANGAHSASVTAPRPPSHSQSESASPPPAMPRDLEPRMQPLHRDVQRHREPPFPPQSLPHREALAAEGRNRRYEAPQSPSSASDGLDDAVNGNDENAVNALNAITTLNTINTLNAEDGAAEPGPERAGNDHHDHHSMEPQVPFGQDLPADAVRNGDAPRFQPVAVPGPPPPMLPTISPLPAGGPPPSVNAPTTTTHSAVSGGAEEDGGSPRSPGMAMINHCDMGSYDHSEMHSPERRANSGSLTTSPENGLPPRFEDDARSVDRDSDRLLHHHRRRQQQFINERVNGEEIKESSPSFMFLPNQRGAEDDGQSDEFEADGDGDGDGMGRMDGVSGVGTVSGGRGRRDGDGKEEEMAMSKMDGDRVDPKLLQILDGVLIVDYAAKRRLPPHLCLSLRCLVELANYQHGRVLTERALNEWLRHSKRRLVYGHRTAADCEAMSHRATQTLLDRVEPATVQKAVGSVSASRPRQIGQIGQSQRERPRHDLSVTVPQHAQAPRPRTQRIRKAATLSIESTETHHFVHSPNANRHPNHLQMQQQRERDRERERGPTRPPLSSQWAKQKETTSTPRSGPGAAGQSQRPRDRERDRDRERGVKRKSRSKWKSTSDSSLNRNAKSFEPGSTSPVSSVAARSKSTASKPGTPTALSLAHSKSVTPRSAPTQLYENGNIGQHQSNRDQQIQQKKLLHQQQQQQQRSANNSSSSNVTTSATPRTVTQPAPQPVAREAAQVPYGSSRGQQRSQQAPPPQLQQAAGGGSVGRGHHGHGQNVTVNMAPNMAPNMPPNVAPNAVQQNVALSLQQPLQPQSLQPQSLQPQSLQQQTLQQISMAAANGHQQLQSQQMFKQPMPRQFEVMAPPPMVQGLTHQHSNGSLTSLGQPPPPQQQANPQPQAPPPPQQDFGVRFHNGQIMAPHPHPHPHPHAHGHPQQPHLSQPPMHAQFGQSLYKPPTQFLQSVSPRGTALQQHPPPPHPQHPQHFVQYAAPYAVTPTHGPPF